MALQSISWRPESLYPDQISESNREFEQQPKVLTDHGIFFFCFFSRIHIKSLKVNETISHECSAIFFTAGRFKTSIECSDLSKSINDENAIAHTYALNTMDDDKLDSQVWRYIPAPEITVVET